MPVLIVAPVPLSLQIPISPTNPMIQQNHKNNAPLTQGISRDDPRRYSCPRCAAAAGQSCRRAGSDVRVADHFERVPADHVVTDRQSPEEAAKGALAFANGYLLTLRPTLAAARLTPKENEVGATALNSMTSERVYLESCHRYGRSLEEMAAQSDRPLHHVARRYKEVVEAFAWKVAPLLEACCQSCRWRMPDVIFDASLRCRQCLALLPEQAKPIPNALEIEELKANCAVLGTTWTASTMDIDAVYEKHLRVWNSVLEFSGRGTGGWHQYAEDARKKGNEAWAFIKAYRAKYGY